MRANSNFRAKCEARRFDANSGGSCENHYGHVCGDFREPCLPSSLRRWHLPGHGMVAVSPPAPMILRIICHISKPALLDTISMNNRPGADGFAVVAARHAMTSSEGGSENYGALPSSYRRRVRKSKSLATVRSSNLRLRLQRSVPFLRRQSTLTFRESPRQALSARHDEAVQLARAQYFSGSDNQDAIDTKQNKSRRSDRPALHIFKKSVRATPSLDEYPPFEVKRSFSLSTTIRNGVRRVIGKTLSRKNSLPPQQLDAQRNYFSEYDHDFAPNTGFDTYQVVEENPTSCPAYPVVPEGEISEDLDTFPGTLISVASRESLHSNARSRVTSWTNSSATGSVTLRSGAIERNRLSIIKEDGGPHQPSSSAGRHIGGVEPSQGSSEHDDVPIPAIDSQRMYSALIKRIAEEDVELERTRLAVDALNRTQEDKEEPLQLKPTIRAVQSDPSLLTLTTDHQSRQFSGQSASSNLDGICISDTSSCHQDKHGRKREQLAEQESQSTFFPFSSEESPNTPSPFKRFLVERRSRSHTRSRSRSSSRRRAPDADDGSVIISRQPSNSIMNRPRFGMSSASVYSRTTNGGSNEQYHRPIDSSDELLSATLGETQATGMAPRATILPTIYTSYRQDNWNLGSSTVEEQKSLHDCDPYTYDESHNWPEKLIEDEGTALSETFETQQPEYTTNAKIPRIQIVAEPHEARAPRKIKSSGDVLSSISNRVEDGRSGSDSLRKLSPGNLARLFKEKRSQRHLGLQSAGKENRSTTQDGSPPISTPGHLHIHFRNGTSTGRLRKRASETAFYGRGDVYSTPHISTQTMPSQSHESPSEIVKHQLVARLSRPFNMDVPPQNRPFDSMYLGKRATGHPDTFGNNRLSVAPRVLEELHETHRQPVQDEETGLPPRSYSTGRSAVKMLGRLGGKRMVSNFLKSRRGDRSTNSTEQNLVDGSPAFV